MTWSPRSEFQAGNGCTHAISWFFPVQSMQHCSCIPGILEDCFSIPIDTSLLAACWPPQPDPCSSRASLDMSLLYVVYIWSLEPFIQNKTSVTVWLHLFVHHSKSWSATRLCLRPTICLFFKQTAVSVPHRLLSHNTVVLARGSIFARPLHNHLFLKLPLLPWQPGTSRDVLSTHL